MIASRLFQLRLWLLRMSKLLWVKATYFALLAVATAVAAMYLSALVPLDLSRRIDSRTIDTILNILASSMLAVTTFSLTTVVSAYAAATSSVTPRATKLLMEDTTAQNALSTFIGSFIFSLIAIIFLNSGLYDQQGKVVLFVVTLGVIVVILVTLIRWIEHLSRLGRVGETSELVEKVAQKALLERAKTPCFGCRPLLDAARDIPENAVPVSSDRTGNIQYVDIEKLVQIAGNEDMDVFVAKLPGSFVTFDSTLLYAGKPPTKETRQKLLDAFVIGDERNFEQDPRFGLCVLAEIAARALSAAMNDYGTAVDIINRGVRLLTVYARGVQREPEIRDESHGRVRIPPLTAKALFEDIFLPVMRNESRSLIVDVRLLKAFSALTRLDNEPFRQEARRYSRQCLQLAVAAVPLDEDKRMLETLAADGNGPSAAPRKEGHSRRDQRFMASGAYDV